MGTCIPLYHMMKCSILSLLFFFFSWYESIKPIMLLNAGLKIQQQMLAHLPMGMASSKSKAFIGAEQDDGVN